MSGRDDDSMCPDDDPLRPDDDSMCPGDEALGPDDDPLLRIEGLEKHYTTTDGFLDRLLGNTREVRAVDGVDLEIRPGETLGLVGESGCGKSSLGRSILRLIEPTAGSISYRGTDLTDLSRAEMRSMRTNVQYVFQDPLASLNPQLSIGDILDEALAAHDIVPPEERAERTTQLLETVGLQASHATRYPHECSGGQRQRVGIARALAVDPEFIVLDEPVSALDASVQAQICNLLAELQAEFDLAYLFIAHDLSVVEHVADRVAVMYLGEIVETGTTEAVFGGDSHPYTEALLSAIPEPDPRWEGDRIVLEGAVPSPSDPPGGCRFHTRCPAVIPPEDVDLETDVFRRVLTLRTRLAEAESGLESLHSSVAAADDVPLAIRKAFDIPARLTDEDADAALSTALEAVAAGDFETAAARLESTFSTPCETESPTLSDDGGHRIACHRFDDEHAAGRPDLPPASR